jgi:hypothetical protein
MRPSPTNPKLSAMWFVDKPGAVLVVQTALKKCSGHRVRAAKELKISVRVLYRYLKKYPEIMKGPGMGSLKYEATPEEMATRERRRKKSIRDAAREGTRS